MVDYYDEQGNSAKKFLMRNPVKGGRYTSGFGDRRHPLFRKIRMHTGVDWAAPSGTPILAAGDGTVERVGREGGYGNYVRIRHANGFATAYGHMSRFAAGVEPGVTVKQGQIIGYVGSTGYSTGPHLHFEVLVNNSFVNPMTIQVPRGLQLDGAPARGVPERAQPHRDPDADGPGHEPRRPSHHQLALSLSTPRVVMPANGFATAYGHMLRFAPGVEPGVAVKQGQTIGYVGSTGTRPGRMSLRGSGQRAASSLDDHSSCRAGCDSPDASSPSAREAQARREPDAA